MREIVRNVISKSSQLLQELVILALLFLKLMGKVKIYHLKYLELKLLEFIKM